VKKPAKATVLPREHVATPHSRGPAAPATVPDDRQEAMSERVRALRLDKEELVQRKARRRVGWLLLILILLAAATAYVYRRPLRSHFRYFEPVPEIDAVTVSEEPPVEIVLNTTGYVISHSIVRVGSRVPGTVVELNVEEGDTIEKGQLLARLDDEQYLADLNQAKASLAAAEAQLAEQRNGPREEDILKARAAVEQAEAHRDLMEEEYSRAKQLEGTISQSEFSRAKSTYLEARAAAEQAAYSLRLVELGSRKERIDALTAEVESAKALVQKAQFFYDETKIVSPIRGKVIDRAVEVGETLIVEALSNSLCRLADFSRLEVEIDIPERDLTDIRLKQPCRITTEAYPDRAYRGQLDWLAPTFNRQRAIRRAKIAIVDPDVRLTPDMNCQVQVLAEEIPEGKDKVIRLPRAALQRHEGQAFLYVVQDDTARRRPVKFEEAGNDKIEILEGLATGEIVLLPGKIVVQDGQKVRVKLTSSDRSG
jgi:membrane fusion protein (multidrug efflux system)